MLPTSVSGEPVMHFRELCAKSADVDRAISTQNALETELVAHCEEFLRLAEGKRRDETPAALLEHLVQAFDEAHLLGFARLAGIDRVIAARAFHDENIHRFIGKYGGP